MASVNLRFKLKTIENAARRTERESIHTVNIFLCILSLFDEAYE